MIDNIPAVGRILLRESILLNGFVRRGGVITKISGNRICFTLQVKHLDGEIELINTYVTKVVAVCDTEEEAEMLLNFEKTCSDERQDLYNQQRKDFYNMTGGKV